MSEDRERRPVPPWWAVAKGLGTVFKQTFRRDNTEQYPKEIVEPPPRAHTGSSARTPVPRMRSGWWGRTTIRRTR